MRGRWIAVVCVVMALGGCQCGEAPPAAPDAGGAASPAASAVAAPRFRSIWKPSDFQRDLLAERSLLALPALVSMSRKDVRSDLSALHRIITRGYIGAEDVVGGPQAWDGAFVRMDARLEEDTRTMLVPDVLQLWSQGIAEVAPGAGVRFVARFEGETREEVVGGRPDLRMGLLEVAPLGEGRWGLDPAGAPSAELLGAEVVRCLGSTTLPEIVPVWSAELKRVLRRPVWLASQVEERAVVECELRLPNGQRRVVAAPLRPLEMNPDTDAVLEGVRWLEGRTQRVLRVAGLDASPTRGAARLEALLREANGAPLVVDLRGAAGDEALGHRLGVALAGGGEVVLPRRSLLSEVSLQGRLNLALDDVAALEAASPPEAPNRDLALEQRLQEAFGRARNNHQEGISRGEQHTVEAATLQLKGLDAPAPSRVVLLVDRDCREGCEAVVAAARAGDRDKRVQVLGEATAGASSLGAPGLYVLPRSRVRVYVATEEVGAPAPGPLPWAGSAPDVWLSGDEALDAAVELLTTPTP